MDSTMETGSIGCRASPTDSGRAQPPTTTMKSTTGTLISSTEPQKKCSSSRPARDGPTDAPADPAALQMPMAVVRCRGSVNTVRISANVGGIRPAPAIPCRARATTSVLASGAKAAATLITPKPTAAISSSRLRPIRSPTLPMVTSKPASMNE